ncbi:MAG: hypothetical protein ACPL7A_01685 [Anaerolineales bacterium]
MPPYLINPLTLQETAGLQMLTVILRQSEDKARDLLRLKRVHGIILSYPGQDRFAFQLYENGKGFLMEFPNETTQVCPELIKRLQDLVGKENIRFEKIVIH